MYEYLPWSKHTLNECINNYQKDIFTILDIELSGACNYQCKYCDSPDRSKCFDVKADNIESLLLSGQIHWIFICGLGEPTFGPNYNQLIKILKIAKSNNVKCSIFTNLSSVTTELLQFIDDEVLYLLFKLDSFNPEYIKRIYGTRNPSNQIANINEIAKHVIIRDNYTNIAASIVPNKYNKDEIPEIVSWCLRHNIFPLIAELEQAGEGKNNFDELSLSIEELRKLRSDIFAMNAEETKVPICPAMISGIHINNQGDITVDQATGFSCHWFWLKNPIVKKIGSFNENELWNCYSKKIKDYRISQTESIKEQIDNYNNDETVFGGCGGAVRDLLLSHLAIHS